MKHLIFLFVFVLMISLVFSVELPESPWHFMDTHTIGAYQFIKAHPTFDGRGVVIIICDTGVDMGVPGLLQTSTGETKVIDAQDFSGQGDISLKKAEMDTLGREPVLTAYDVRLENFHDLNHQPSDSVYWMGVIDEHKMFQNSRVKDINNNGQTDDMFGLITFPVRVDDKERWVYYLDEDADGSLLEEKPRFSYRYDFDSFTFAGRDAHDQGSVLTCALNICPDEKMASLHSPDNSHGTHCAGIASGYQLFGEPTQHGVAPGAKIISCKIGNATLAGGATTTGSMKKAYEYGLDYAKEQDMPVVFSMSYGVGSEIEGRSDIENFLNNLMDENENILVVTSNGNEGPGLSTTGNPAGAFRLASIGAMMPHEHARDSYGFTIDSDRIFHFSSRGGELRKPDFVTPGSAASSVPYHDTRENKWGTSMACPQAAGAAAVLISACEQQDIPYNAAVLKRAMKYSASPIPGYTPLDQGTGILNIEKALSLLKTYADRDEHEKLLDYKIETTCPSFDDSKGRMAYWRTGSYIPPEDEKQVFDVNPLFPESMTAQQKADFYRAYRLESDQSWLKLDKSSTFIRGEQAAHIGAYYRHDELAEPGFYVATITAFPKSGPGRDIPEFQILATAIVPFQATPENDYSIDVTGKTLKAGQHHRYFVDIPPGASAMTVTLKPDNNKWCKIYGYLHKPDGVLYERFPLINPDDKEPVRITVPRQQLDAGIWEIVPSAYYNTTKTSTFDMHIEFDGLDIQPDTLTNFTFENGEKPQGTFRVVNHFSQFEGTAKGRLRGYQKTEALEISSDIYEQPLKINEDVERLTLRLEMSEETWGLFTDVAFNVIDKDGTFVLNDGFMQRKRVSSFRPAPGEYTLRIVAGFTYPSKTSESWQLKLTEIYETKQDIPLSVEKNGESRFNLYPGIPAELMFELQQTPSMVPDGYHHFGSLEFISDKDEQKAARVPISFCKE